MHLSEAGLDLIQQSEGFRSTTYLDSAGLATIGYGHKLTAGESFPDGITRDQATAILMEDVATAEAAVSRLVTVQLTQGQFDALVDFVFNLGAGRLAGSTLLRELNGGQFDDAGEQLLRWDHCGTQELEGLKLRREAELQLWKTSASSELTAS